MRKGIYATCAVLVLANALAGTFADNILASEIDGVGIAPVVSSIASEEREIKTIESAPLMASVNLTQKAQSHSVGKRVISTKVLDGSEKETDPTILKQLDKKKNGLYDNIAIAKIDGEYVNVRAAADAGSKVLGKIYNNAAAKIIKTVKDKKGAAWYKIKSGKVTGFIKAEFFVTGDAAEKLATKVGYVYATINTKSLRLRKSADLGSNTITILTKGEVYTVESRGEEFTKISIDGELVGYVSNDYITISVKYKEAISLEEEAKKKAEEARRRAEAEEAARRLREEESREAARKAAKKTTKSSKKNKETTKYTGSNKASAKRKAIVAEALKYYGVLPYVLGGDSLEDGTDCSGFVQQIYMMFGIDLPRVSDEQGCCGKEVSYSEIKKGDLVYYGGHIAIYIGNGEVIHCSSPKSDPNTKISSWNYRSVKSIRNVMGD